MAGASHVSGAAPEPEAALRKLAPMSSDLKVAFLVLQDIGSKDLDQYIESIKNDAPKVQNEIEVLRKELQSFMSPLIEQCGDLLKKLDGSLAKLRVMRDNTDRNSPDRLVAEDQLPRF